MEAISGGEPLKMRPRRWHSLTPLIEKLEFTNGVMVEVGSYTGESTVMFAQCGKFKEIHAIDPWSNEHRALDLAACDMKIVEKHFDKRVAPYSMIIKHKTTSRAASNKFHEVCLDLVYIDAIHTYEELKADIFYWLSKIKKGGYIAGHDYNSRSYPGVVQVVKESFQEGKIYPGSVYVFKDTSWLVRL